MTYLALHDLISQTPNTSALKSVTDKAIDTNYFPLESTANVASLLQFTIPDGKLFYPEPFIASPSYLYSDLTYLHIFQYWYWLWFLFIFLICFFFISFLCTIRWCQNRVRPRRETRGVSRSKCGDLITACVPVSWAVSIIVSESTDAIDLNDGFGTAELIIGVRAYQWGWEYYYPKTIDLNYSVRPSYSSFIGNSLQYNYSSSRTLTSNSFWRMYQNKLEDRVITPAHLLLLPVDSSSTLNFVNFKNVGLNTLKESSAFSKVRNFTKVYNTHLVSTPSSFSNKYSTLHNVFVDENQSLTSSSFGLKRQHNLASSTSIGNSNSTLQLDQLSFNRYLNSNLNMFRSSNRSTANMGVSTLLLDKGQAIRSPEVARFSPLINAGEIAVAPAFVKLTAYPTLLENVNDNGDKKGLLYPALKLSSSTIVKGIFANSDIQAQRYSPNFASSATATHHSSTKFNAPVTYKVFSLANTNSKVLLTDQSIRSFPELLPSKSNYNLSGAFNAELSNEQTLRYLNKSYSPLVATLNAKTNYADYGLTSNLLSLRTFISNSYPAVLSSDPMNSNSLEYDATTSQSVSRRYSQSALLDLSLVKKNLVSEAFIGSREKSPKAINTAYWSTFWATSNPKHRVNGLLNHYSYQANSYLPPFIKYSDYDFRNDQAAELLEELFWETNYSTYNFSDYMAISKESNKGQSVEPEQFVLEKKFPKLNLDVELQASVFSASPLKDQTGLGAFYSSGVQMENYLSNPATLSLNDFVLLPAFGDIEDFEDSFASFKGMKTLLAKFSTSALLTPSSALLAKSYLETFNHFRGDYEDFSWARSLSSHLDTSLVDAQYLANQTLDEGSAYGNDLRLSNVATLRSSIRNSVVTYNAFQKVFRPRLDEGRALTHGTLFADLKLKQPLISDYKIPYTSLLGKNRESFFETPLHTLNLHKNFNDSSTLLESLNTQMFDFPFLLAATSDIIRFTWLDWFAKWKYVEVQPASTSRYSTLGVPYLRKPYDFNSNAGDVFQNTELYFTRISRSRRNYMPHWVYSPFLYNRSYIWNVQPNFDLAFYQFQNSASAMKFTCQLMKWYWKLPEFESNSLRRISYSHSGNDIYAKSTWRPTASFASYAYNTSRLVDILSRREFLLRQYLENAHSVVHLPASLCATPNNKLLQELKSSFLFVDPANFNSEHARDALYTSTSYLKFIYLQNVAQRLNEALSSAPINTDMLTTYILFYFTNAYPVTLGKNSELYKTQFRPLRKGISNMLRLQGTGAVAMPVGIRLQILASSRDVIHSWAIPAAAIKIDCVPGYTSHRIMKFLLTGIYWGQCQEICGRYHHWMPIIVKFDTPDNFAVWVTHFVSVPAPNEVWDISDRRFANLLQCASYDRSSWLNNLSLNQSY